MTYTTIFDISQRGINWMPLIFSCVVGLIYFQAVRVRKTVDPLIVLGITIGIALIASIAAYQYSNLSYYRTLLAQNNASVVEGVIEQFHPMPKSGHDTERFVVDGVLFTYSDYFATPAFNNTRSHGGPLHEGLPVRIYYAESREFDGHKAILRIDVHQASVETVP